MSAETIIGGSLLCTLAGVGVGTFLLPLKFSKSWRWENSWLIGCFFMYLLFPLIGLRIFVPDFVQIFQETPFKDILWVYVFGLIQGTGAYVFTYATTLLGLSLGYALMISCISLVSLLVVLFGAHIDRVKELDGITLLVGAGLLVLGFAFAGRAGLARERETPRGAAEKMRKKLNIPFIAVLVLWTGVANSMYYFTFEFQGTMKDIATKRYGVPDYAWAFLNVVPFFLGLFTMNLIITGAKMFKDGSVKNYWAAPGLGREYLLAAGIGFLWYLGQGVAYPCGQGILGPLGVAVGAALFMGMIIVVSNLTGLWTGEWKAASARTQRSLHIAVVILVVAMALVAVGNYLQQIVYGKK